MAVQTCSVMAEDLRDLPQRFERKFYLPPLKIDTAYMLLRSICLPDSEFPSEQINSLYFDTHDLDQHQRSIEGDFRKDKVRIRWYGEDNNLNGKQTVFIELKTKEGFVSTKQRKKLQVPAEALSLNNLCSGIIPNTLLCNTLYSFGYFPTDKLQPVIKISYWRYRFTDILSSDRIALDSRIRSTAIMPGIGQGEKDLELKGAVIEIKGRLMDIPLTLKDIHILDSDWSRFSKYSACIESHMEKPGIIGRLSPSGRVI